MARYLCYVLETEGRRIGQPKRLKRNAEAATRKIDRYLLTHPFDPSN